MGASTTFAAPLLDPKTNELVHYLFAFLVLLEEKKRHLLHMKQDIPLTDLELAAVEGDLEATEKLIEQLTDVPTPAGPTPCELQENREHLED
ncbi:MAG TPA: hypothetical protein VFZ66_27305 [Herpetosiphonaceae bacterium]